MRLSKYFLLLIAGSFIFFFQNCAQRFNSIEQVSASSNSLSEEVTDTPAAPEPDPVVVVPEVPPLPSSTGLFTIDKMQYQGAFRLPMGPLGDSSVYDAVGAIGYNPDHKSLFIAGKADGTESGSIAEFLIPVLVKSTKISDLNTSPNPLQKFSHVVGRRPIDAGQGIRVSGIYYSNKKLLVNVYRFYDQGPFLDAPTLIFENADNIATSVVRGYLKGDPRAGGWISPIPSEWQGPLGGTHTSGFTSSTYRANVYSSSVGPVAFSFNPDVVMANSSTVTSVSHNELLSYGLSGGLIPDGDLFNLSGKNLWTGASEGSFGMILPGTNSYIVLGMSGGHNGGVAYGDPPYGGDKGYYPKVQSDIYPYYWLYDVNDFVKVRNGTKKPNELRPYAYGKFNVPFQTDTVNKIAGGTYDSVNKIIYLSVYRADKDGFENAPIIVAYKHQN